MGTSTTSSLLAGPDEPFAWRMPTSSKGRPPILMSLPTSAAVMPRLLAVSEPLTATLRPSPTDAPLSELPCQIR